MKNATVATLIVALIAAVTVLAEDKAAEMAPLDIKLPDALFTGTPKNIRTANLEPSRKDKKRPPFSAPKGAVNVAAGKKVTSSDMQPIIGELEFLVDGDKDGGMASYVELGPMKQYVQIDLGARFKIYAIVLWHYHSQARVYRDVVIQVADDPDFIMGVKSVFNNDHDNSAGLGIGKDKEWIETYEGKLVDTKGIVTQHLRLYSNGSTTDDLNHYVEVEVYGLPAK